MQHKTTSLFHLLLLQFRVKNGQLLVCRTLATFLASFLATFRNSSATFSPEDLEALAEAYAAQSDGVVFRQF